MDSIEIAGLDTEVVSIDDPVDLIFQFRMRSADGQAFTYQMEVSESAFAADSGYGGDFAAMLDDLQRMAEVRVNAGRREDLSMRRYEGGWASPMTPEQRLPPHSSIDA